MEYRQAKVIKKSITISYSCIKGEPLHTVKLTDFKIGTGKYFEDWEYDFVAFQCPLCNEYHKFEI